MSKGVPLSGKATVDALADNWGKILAIIMTKLQHEHIVVTAQDIETMGKNGVIEKTLVVQELDDGLHIRLMPLAEAQKLAQQNKGGFGKS